MIRRFDNLQGSLADVVHDPLNFDDHCDVDEFWIIGHDQEDEFWEPDPEAYYHDFDPDAEPELVDEHDPNEIILPFTGTLNVCHGSKWYSKGEQRWCKRHPKFNVKPKHKDHRS